MGAGVSVSQGKNLANKIRIGLAPEGSGVEFSGPQDAARGTSARGVLTNKDRHRPGRHVLTYVGWVGQKERERELALYPSMQPTNNVKTESAPCDNKEACMRRLSGVSRAIMVSGLCCEHE